MKIAIQKLDPRAMLPTYGSLSAAGADLYLLAEQNVEIPAGETRLLHTGIAVAIPEGYAGLIYARSGLATKRNLAPANKVGVVDADYRGEVMVALHNHGSKTELLMPGERIAQLVVTPFLRCEMEEADTLPATDRGTGGFGSTGR